MNSLTHDIFAVCATSVKHIGQVSHDGYTLTSTAFPPKQLVVDTIVPVVGDWVFLRAQLDTTQNGIYQVVQVANISTNTVWKLQRNHPGGNLFNGMLIYTFAGSANIGKIYRITSTNPITVGIDAITSTDAPFSATLPTNSFSGDILADDGTKILDNGTSGSLGDAWFQGNVKADNGADIITASTSPSTSTLTIGTLNITTELIFTNPSSQILAPANTTAPPYSFYDDTDTGIAYNGADDISLETGGINALTIDPTQNITLGGNFLTFTPNLAYTVTHTSTANTQDLNFTQVGAVDASLILSSAGTGVDAITLNATNAASGIYIDSGTGGMSIDSTGQLSLNGVDLTLSANNSLSLIAAPVFPVTGGLSMTTSGVISVDAATGIDFSVDTNINFTDTSTTGIINIESNKITFPAIKLGGDIYGDEIRINHNDAGYTTISTSNIQNYSLLRIDGHLIGVQPTTPGLVVGAPFAAGAGLSGTDMGGRIQFTSAAGTGTLTITYTQAYPNTPVVVISPGPGDTYTTFQITAMSTTGFTITATGSAAIASEINYFVVGI